MKTCSISLAAAWIVISAAVYAQSDAGATHRAAAVAAAGQDLGGLLAAACPPATQSANTQQGQPGRGRGGPGGVPRPALPRDQWYAEPVKVFDNLYFVGTKVHGA